MATNLRMELASLSEISGTISYPYRTKRGGEVENDGLRYGHET